MRDRLRRSTIAWWAAGAWAAVIFAASSVPGSRIPGHFGPYAHFTEYAILAGLLVLALRDGLGARRAAAWAVAMASLYGITDEFHQHFVPLRTPDPVDWMVDTTGAIAGAVAVTLVIRALERRRDRA